MLRFLTILALLLAFPASAQFNGCAPGYCNASGSAAPSVNTFVAVGARNSFADPITSTSSDAVTWTQRTSDPATGTNLFGISANNSFAISVGVTSDYGDPIIAKSTDTATWVQKTLSQTVAQLSGVNCSGPLCIAVGYYFTGDNPELILKSSDGDTWTDVSPVANAQLFGAAYCGGTTYVVVGASSDPSADTPTILTSTGAATSWTLQTADPATLTRLLSVSCDGTNVIAVGTSTVMISPGTPVNPIIMTAPVSDVTTWTQQTSDPATVGIWNSVHCTSSLCVAVGAVTTGGVYSNPLIATSPDHGITWTSRTPDPATNAVLYGVTFAGGKWVAVGADNSFANPIIMTSADAITWTSQTSVPTTDANLYAVAGAPL